MSDALARVPEAFLAWALPMAWQAALLVGVVLVLDRVLARAPACVRPGRWMLVAVRLLLPASLGSPLALLPAAGASPVPGDSVVAAAPAPLWPFLLWALGAATAAVVVVRRSRLRLAEWRRGAVLPTPALLAAVADAARRAGLRRPPQVLLSTAAPGPLVLGLLHPLLVLPVALLARRPEAVQHVLLHECTHLSRRDLWAEALFALAALLFWWHPLVGLARRRARDVRELACDATVALRLGTETPAYRATLLALALEAPGRTAFAGGAAFLPRPYGIVARLDALERGAPRRPWCARAAALLLPLLVGAALLPRARAPLAPVDEREAAHAHLSAMLAGPDKPGCFALRFAVLRCVAAEERVVAVR